MMQPSQTLFFWSPLQILFIALVRREGFAGVELPVGRRAVGLRLRVDGNGVFGDGGA